MKKLLVILSALGLLLFFPALAFAGNPPVQSDSTYSTPSGSTAADGSSQATITINLRDGSSPSNPVEGDSIKLTSSNDSTANFDNNQTTDNNGNVTFTMTSTTAGGSNVTVTDTTTNTVFTDWFAVNFTTASTASPSPTPLSCSGVPSAPILSSVVSNSNYQATLTWEDSADPVSNYLVSYGVTSGKYIYGDPNIGSQGTTSFTVGSLGGDKKYYFAVSASNPCGISSFSNEVAAVINPISETPAPTVEPTTAPDTSVSDIASDMPTDTPQPTDSPTPTPAPAAGNTNTTFRNLGIGIVVAGIIVIGLVFIIQKTKKKNKIPPMMGDTFRRPPAPPMGNGFPQQQNPPMGGNIPQQPGTPISPNQFG
jgi:hypothetical protein